MKIRELLESEGIDDFKLSISAIVNQIASRVKDTGANQPVNIDVLVDALNSEGYHITAEQLRDMYDSPPLNNSIANIEGDDVIFKGQRAETSDAVKPDQSTSTLEKMAKRAAKK